MLFKLDILICMVLLIHDGKAVCLFVRRDVRHVRSRNLGSVCEFEIPSRSFAVGGAIVR